MLYKFYWKKGVKSAQAGVEYMIIVAFVTFVILTVLSFAIFFSGSVSDRVKVDRVENFAVRLVNSAEMVFFSGEPSKTTVMLSLPGGVDSITVQPNGILFEVSLRSGKNVRFFESSVPLSGSVSSTEGVKEIEVIANSNGVVLS